MPDTARYCVSYLGCRLMRPYRRRTSTGTNAVRDVVRRCCCRPVHARCVQKKPLITGEGHHPLLTPKSLSGENPQGRNLPPTMSRDHHDGKTTLVHYEANPRHRRRHLGRVQDHSFLNLSSISGSLGEDPSPPPPPRDVLMTVVHSPSLFRRGRPYLLDRYPPLSSRVIGAIGRVDQNHHRPPSPPSQLLALERRALTPSPRQWQSRPSRLRWPAPNPTRPGHQRPKTSIVRFVISCSPRRPSVDIWIYTSRTRTPNPPMAYMTSRRFARCEATSPAGPPGHHPSSARA